MLSKGGGNGLGSSTPIVARCPKGDNGGSAEYLVGRDEPGNRSCTGDDSGKRSPAGDPDDSGNRSLTGEEDKEGGNRSVASALSGGRLRMDPLRSGGAVSSPSGPGPEEEGEGEVGPMGDPLALFPSWGWLSISSRNRPISSSSAMWLLYD